MITVNVPPRGGTLLLGRQGENEARQLVFDVSGWVELYGEGTVVLLHQRRGDSAPYPVAVTAEDAAITWTVSSADTANAGTGRAELQYIVGDTLAKSCVYATAVKASLDEAGEAPDPETGWVAQMLARVQALVDAGFAALESALEPRVAALEETTSGLTELLDASDCEDGTILVTLNGEWVRLCMGLVDISEEEF